MSRFDRLWRVFDRMAVVGMLTASVVVIWRVWAPVSVGSLPQGSSNGQEMAGTLPAEVLKADSAKGAPQARLAVVEFSDYQCPFCGQYARDVHPQVQRAFVDSGKVRYVLVNLPLERLHPHAFKAAEAAESGRQGKYWAMHDQLFANQKALLEDDLTRYADVLGLNQAAFKTCLSGETSATIKADLALADKFQLNGTPVFLVGEIQSNGTIKLRRKISGALSFTAFEAVLNDLL